MAFTFFGVATTPADNSGASTGPDVTVTPPASMADGDLVYVSVRYRASTGTLSVKTSGGQTWNQAGAQYNTTNIRAAIFWCRFNGTWSANPVFTVTSGTNNIDAQMIVFRPSGTSYTLKVESGENSATYTAPSSPFTVSITGRTTTAASTVSIAAWHSVDDNSWGNLSGTGWSKTSLGAQYRNNDTADNSSSFAYYIATSAGTAIPNVSQQQTALGGDAGSTSLVTFSEEQVVATPSGNAATASAGSLAVSNEAVGIAGVQSTAAAGTANVPDGGGSTNATGSPTGVSSISAAGTALVNVGAVPVGASATAQAGAPIESVSAVPVGIAATSAAGSASGLAAAPGTGAPGGIQVTASVGAIAAATASAISGMSAAASAGSPTVSAGGATPVTTQAPGAAATSAAGSLGGAVTVVGIAGVASSALAGDVVGNTGTFGSGTGQPKTVAVTAQLGTVSVPTLAALAGVEALAVAESIESSLTVEELDGAAVTATAGDAPVAAAASLLGASASAAVGSTVQNANAVVQTMGLASQGTVGNLTGGANGSPAVAVQGVAVSALAGDPQLSWTTMLSAEGVVVTAVAGTATVQGGDSAPTEVYPAGVEAIAAAGTPTSPSAIASPLGVRVTLVPGTVTGIGARPPVLVADGIFVVPEFDADAIVAEPILYATGVKLEPIQ